MKQIRQKMRARHNEWYCCVLTLRGSCVQTLGQTKKASHFEVDLETKQKERSPSCQKRNSCETANHFYVQTKKASHFEVDLETKQNKGHHLARNGIRVRQQNDYHAVGAIFAAFCDTLGKRQGIVTLDKTRMGSSKEEEKEGGGGGGGREEGESLTRYTSSSNSNF